MGEKKESGQAKGSTSGMSNTSKKSLASAQSNVKKTMAAMGALGKISPKKSTGDQLVTSALRMMSGKPGKVDKNVRLEALKLAATEKFRKLGSSRTTSSSSKSTGESRNSSSQDEKANSRASELSNLELKLKRSSMIFRELGIQRHKPEPPSPELYDVQVQKRRRGRALRSFRVLKPADAGANVLPQVVCGPQWNSKGEIIPHSILGDPDQFIHHAEQLGQFQDLTTQYHESRAVTKLPALTKRRKLDPLLLEDRPLKQWNTEMNIRNKMQRYLADKVQRPRNDLVMSRSDSYADKASTLRLLDDRNPSYHGSVCFWRQEERIGAKQIIPTLTRSEQGRQPTPVICGDAEAIMVEKLKYGDSGGKPGAWFNSPYVRETLASHDGVIQVANHMIFKDLIVQGEPIYTRNHSNNGVVSRNGQLGPKEDNSDELLFGKGVNSYANGHGESKGGNGDFANGFSGVMGDYCARLGNNSVAELARSGSEVELFGEGGLSEVDSLTVLRTASSRKDRSVLGPALFAGEKLLRWSRNTNQCSPNSANLVTKGNKHRNNGCHDSSNNHGNGGSGCYGNNNACERSGNGCYANTSCHGNQHNSMKNRLLTNESQNCSNSPSLEKPADPTNQSGHDSQLPSNKVIPGCQSKVVAMETMIHVQGKVNEVATCHVVLQNVGSTVLRYHWMKVPKVPSLPIPRLFKRTFYFNDSSGILLPNEKRKVQMLFRSKHPGHYTESWILKTEPVLENGAEIRFDFRGVATQHVDFGSQIQEIEDYLAVKEARTIARGEAEHIFKVALRQAELREGRLREELDIPYREKRFEEFNPGMYFHDNVVKRLESMSNRVAMETEIAKTGETDTFDTGSQKLPACIITVNDVCSADTVQESENTLQLAHLRQMLLSLPDVYPQALVGQTAVAKETKKQTLLQEMNKEVCLLSFPPLQAMSSDYQRKYGIVYSLLQTGVDNVVTKATNLADILDLIKEEEEEVKPVVEKLEPVNKKTKQKGARAKTPKKSKLDKGVKGKSFMSMDAAPTSPYRATSPVQAKNEAFSVVHKFRLSKEAQDTNNLETYDEKIYLEMYGMLLHTIDQMSELF